VASDLSTKDGWIILTAAEIDLATYGELVAAVFPCFTPAGCQPDLIRGFFTNYLTKSQELMSDQLVGALGGRFNTVSNIGDRIYALNSTLVNALDRIEGVPSKIEAIKGRICDTGSCIDAVTDSYLKNGDTSTYLSLRWIKTS